MPSKNDDKMSRMLRAGEERGILPEQEEGGAGSADLIGGYFGGLGAPQAPQKKYEMVASPVGGAPRGGAAEINSVPDYSAYAKAPKSISTSIRLPSDIHDAVRAIMDANPGVSANQVMVNLMREALQRYAGAGEGRTAENS